VKTLEECRDWMNSVNTLTRPVADIVVNDGYQCKFDGCTYTVKDRYTARKHVQDHEVDPDIYLSEVKVQNVFNSYLHKYCVVEAENTEFDMETERGRTLAAFRQQAKELLPKASPIGILFAYTWADFSVCKARFAVGQRIHRMVTMGSAGGWNRMEDIAGYGSDSDDKRPSSSHHGGM
jgi:hypothetical protein